MSFTTSKNKFNSSRQIIKPQTAIVVSQQDAQPLDDFANDYEDTTPMPELINPPPSSPEKDDETPNAKDDEKVAYFINQYRDRLKSNPLRPSSLKIKEQPVKKKLLPSVVRKMDW